MVTGGNLKEPLIRMTNPFGYYSFADLEVGETYVIQVRAKQYFFNQPSMVISLTGDVTDANFIGTHFSSPFDSR